MRTHPGSRIPRSVKSRREPFPKHDEGNADTCVPRELGHRLIGSEVAGVDELDVNGRSLNRPVLEECSKSGCVRKALDADRAQHFGRIAEVCSKNAAAVDTL